MSRDIPDQTEVDIGAAWRAADRLVSQYRDIVTAEPLVAKAIICAGAIVASALYEVAQVIRIASWED